MNGQDREAIIFDERERCLNIVREEWARSPTQRGVPITSVRDEYDRALAMVSSIVGRITGGAPCP